MEERRYRLELKEVGTERIQVAAQECTSQEIANLVVVRAQNPRDAMHMNDWIRANKPFGDRKHIVVWGAFEFYAVELPAKMEPTKLTSAAIEEMREQLLNTPGAIVNPDMAIRYGGSEACVGCDRKDIAHCGLCDRPYSNSGK